MNLLSEFVECIIVDLCCRWKTEHYTFTVAGDITLTFPVIWVEDKLYENYSCALLLHCPHKMSSLIEK